MHTLKILLEQFLKSFCLWETCTYQSKNIALSPRGLVLLKMDLPKIKVPQNGHYNSKLYNKSSPIFHPFYLKLERSSKRRELESKGRLTEPKGKRWLIEAESAWGSGGYLTQLWGLLVHQGFLSLRYCFWHHVMSALKIKCPVILPEKWVFSGIAEELQWRLCILWWTVGKSREQRRETSIYRGKDCLERKSIRGEGDFRVVSTSHQWCGVVVLVGWFVASEIL